MFKRNGNPINILADLVIGFGVNAITIPAASLQDQATRAQYGITEHPDQPRPDDRYYWVEENGDGTYSAKPKDIADIKRHKMAELSASRFRLETSGITLPNGVRIATDRDSQGMLSGALLTVQRNPAALIDWKGEDGWSQINKAGIEAIADAVSTHVQACFSAERAQCEALDALTEFGDVIAFDPTVSI